MIHFCPLKPSARCASERIADRRKVDMTAELFRDVKECRQIEHERALIESFVGKRENEPPWYVGNREHGEDK
jgi:hypothetical protein